MFAALYAADGSLPDVLLGVARDFSPRIETYGSREVILDLGGLTRLFGDAKTIAGELRRTAADRGLRVRIAIAGTRTAARLLAHGRAGITIVNPATKPPRSPTCPSRCLRFFDRQNPLNRIPLNPLNPLHLLNPFQHCAAGD